MLHETVLLHESERLVLDRAILDPVALPVGDNYGDDVFSDYLDVYSGVGRRYKPKRVLEIGVRYGYCAIFMQLGCRKNPGQPQFQYLGIDDESYHAHSCARANQNFAALCPGAVMEAIQYNSMTQGLPPECGTFDLCHIDGNHDYAGVAGDLELCWPALNPGGLIILDDAKPVMDDGSPAPIYSAIQDFLKRFEYSPNRVEWQLIEDLRWHVLIRKG